jgi:hypothetical protein
MEHEDAHAVEWFDVGGPAFGVDVVAVAVEEVVDAQATDICLSRRFRNDLRRRALQTSAGASASASKTECSRWPPSASLRTARYGFPAAAARMKKSRWHIRQAL